MIDEKALQILEHHPGWDPGWRTTNIKGHGATYLGAPLRKLDSKLRQVVSKGIIDIERPFLDAGCGDGRVLALASRGYGLRSVVGVEYDPDLADIARRNIEEMSIPSAQVAQGDFTEDSTYSSIGMRFEDFGTVFNFICNDRQIAKKIIEQSPHGTIFVLYGVRDSFRRFNGLKKVYFSEPDGGFGLQVYRKQDSLLKRCFSRRKK